MSKKNDLFNVFFVFVGLLALASVGIIAVVAAHFISKYW